VPGIAQQRHLAANQPFKRLDIMDFNAVGGLRIEGGDQLLHLRRPAAKVAAEIRPQGAAILGQPRRQRNIKEKVKPAIGDRHQRHPFPLADEGGPLVARRNRLINSTRPFQLT
jgi:hypothetical protein